MARRIGRQFFSSLALSIVGGAVGCSGDFDRTRNIPPRGTLGTELFTLICDRVGAQSLPEDITGQSFHAVCHADREGLFADRVDLRFLPELPSASIDRAGNEVTTETLRARRKYHIDRIERLGAHRDELVLALDDLVADETIARKDTTNADPAQTCNQEGTTTLHQELPAFLERITSLYNDGTLPELTRAFGRTLGDVESAEDAREALARLEARKGYRPPALSQGIAKPILSYPGLVDLANTLLKSIATDSDALSPEPILDSTGLRIAVAGPAQPAFQNLLAALHEKQREPESHASATRLSTQVDPRTGWTVLSRPRSSLELAQAVLLSTDDSFARTTLPDTVRYVVKRDARGVAAVEARNGQLPSPFVDDNKDGLADLDSLGQFVVAGTSTESTTPSPFHIPKFGSGTSTIKRDSAGRALASDNKPVFASLDLTRTALSSLRADLRTAVDPDPKYDVLGKLAAGLPVALGRRGAVTAKEYAADSSLADDWKLRFNEPVPRDLGKTPNTITYRPISAESSPLYALVRALGRLLSKPNAFDALQVVRQLVQDHPKALARIVSVAFEAKRIADAHPEAKIPAKSTFWDEVFDSLVNIAQVPKKSSGRGLIEDTIAAFAHDKTASLQSTFGAYVEFRDQLTYNRNPPSPGAKPDINSAPWNLTTSSVAPLQTPVDRSQPDVGDNRSVLQRFLQLLHDANGLAVCTKQDAVVHIKIKWNGIPINLDYPSNQLVSVPACLLVGAITPSKTMRKCGMLRLENVALLVIDVVLGRAKFDIRDDCLRRLMDSPLTSLVGGVDKFLEEASGIKGLSTSPSVPGISRMLYFETKAAGFNDVPFLAGDPTPDFQTKPKAFLEGVIDVAPSMACNATPFVDPSDGKTIQLRTCDNYSDTLRVRDANALFPVEQNDFVANIKPLAEAFGNYGDGAQLFIDLFENLHRHWASTAQSKDMCDPSLPHTDARWCSGDGLVSYEPILVEILRKTDLLQSIQELVKALNTIRIEHCDTVDEKTGLCKKSTTRDGIVVLGDLIRDLVDPEVNKGLTDALGRSYSLRNDGTKNAQTTPLYLIVDALGAIDKEFANHSEGGERLPQWRSARSVLTDLLLGVKGTGSKADFANPGIPKMVNVLVDTLASQIAAHCPDRTKTECKWASADLPNSTKDVLEGPLFASAIDLLDELQKDSETRKQIDNFLVYLLADSDHDAMASALAGITDLLQSLGDDTTRIPVARATRALVGTRVTDDKGRTVRTSVADAVVGLLSRILARGRNADGDRVCGKELDPNEALVLLLRRAVATKTPLEPSPADTLANVAAEVNRSDPSSTAKLASPDYANTSKELREFCLDKGRGLEQIYEVIRQATQ